jgi:hypothetical protein
MSYLNNLNYKIIIVMENKYLFPKKKVFSSKKNSYYLCEFSNEYTFNEDGTFNLDFTSDSLSLSANGTYSLDEYFIYGVMKFTHVRDRRYPPVEFNLEVPFQVHNGDVVAFRGGHELIMEALKSEKPLSENEITIGEPFKTVQFLSNGEYYGGNRHGCSTNRLVAYFTTNGDVHLGRENRC